MHLSLYKLIVEYNKNQLNKSSFLIKKKSAHILIHQYNVTLDIQLTYKLDLPHPVGQHETVGPKGG